MNYVKNQFSISTVRKRLFALICAITFIFLFLIARLYVVQVKNGENLQIKAVDQWTRELPVKAKRGKITDCNGEVLASSKGTYAVYVRSRSVKNKSYVASVLSDVLSVDKDVILSKIDKNVSEITVKTQVEKEIIQKLSQYDLPGVYFSLDSTREYPFSQTLSQILGYVSSDGMGQSGIEAYYDKYLKGDNGEIIYQSDLIGIDLQNSKANFVPAIDGLNVALTIDNEIQQICEGVISQAFERYTPKNASVIVLDCNTGGVKAICTYPSYDLNSIPRDDLDLLNSQSRSIPIVDSYEPGSTFKIITASANIQEYFNGNNKAFSPEHIFSSGRFRYVDGSKIKCWSTHDNGKHANENLALALNNSCNPIFVDIALSLGKETFYEYLKDLGFGKVTGIDFFGESQGMVIPVSAVKNGDLARIGFGQTIAVTPLQLVCAVNTCINGGRYYTPYLVDKIYDDNGKVLEKFLPKYTTGKISSKTSKLIASYLEGVVANGSGKQAYIERYKVAGKTGTAQKYSNGVIAHGKYIMSFIGFFPSNAPQYIALVTVDEPVGGTYGSTVAAPLCREIFEKIIQCKKLKPIEET